MADEISAQLAAEALASGHQGSPYSLPAAANNFPTPSSFPSAPSAADGSSPRPPVQLCASCDRCRARKTKCDGGRPCTNCVTRYRRVNKVDG